MADGDVRDPLFFLPPSRREWKGEKRPRPQVTTPTPGGQGKRMAPRFAELQKALSGERAKLVDVPDDADPELVAVFDLATTEDAFARAVQKIEGLEFLAGFDFDKVTPDQDFHFQDDDGALADDLVQQSIYMVMTNAAAVDQLISLFQRWQADPKITFDRGLNPLKHAGQPRTGSRRRACLTTGGRPSRSPELRPSGPRSSSGFVVKGVYGNRRPPPLLGP
jgi:hypothetical protein